MIAAIVGFTTGFLGMITGASWYKHEILESFQEETEVLFSNNRELMDPGISMTKVARDSSLFEKDFVDASTRSTSSVVFIQTVTEYEYGGRSVFDWFFEPRSTQQVSSGSGVIFSSDGYIVTNNHVIEDADLIKVTIGKKIVDGELIGADPSSDLALIKVDESDLPAIALGSSEDVRVGEWVLAVGNPFNLTSTVTAGIVSAKGRNINILRDRFPIESFIQTDAAINPGNSGGALVDRNGKLIGINTAILSRTGSYAGYGFAVPVDIVKKVYKDLREYGQVQKALTGAEFIDVDSEVAEKLGLEDYNGVIITDILRGSAAEKSKLEKGDVIKKINGEKVSSKAFMEEYIAQLYPGDKISLEISRDNREITKDLVLTNRDGTTKMLRREIFQSQELGVTFESVSKVEKSALGIRGGVRVVDYENRGFFSKLDIPKGFIITSINGTVMDDPEELSNILIGIRGRVIIVGVNKNGRQDYYPFRF